MDFSKTPTFNLMGGGGGGSSLMRASEKKTPKRSFPAYTLQGGYDKYVTLPTAPSKDQRPRTIVPRHTKGLRVPLGESLMKGEFMKNFADAGTFHRVGFFSSWHFRLLNSFSICLAFQACLCHVTFALVGESTVCWPTAAVRVLSEKCWVPLASLSAFS